MKTARKNPQSIAYKVLRHFSSRPAGRVISGADLAGLGSPRAVDQALSRLARSGYLKRVGRGLYVRPRVVPGFGEVPTPSSAVVGALLDPSHVKVQIAPGAAAYAMGLITQVPGRRILYAMSHHTSRTLKRYGVEVRHTTSRKKMLGAGTTVGVVVQALRFLGPSSVSDEALERIRGRLSDADRSALMRELRGAPRWMQPHLRAIAASPGEV